ncbi:MAG: aminoacyl-tRNA hydrolase [Desulfobacterales bacterium]
MTKTDRWLIAGLGNPGDQYRNTRHNLGFMVVDKIAEDFRISFGKKKFNADFGKGRILDSEAILVKPMTYMNLSGPAVRGVADYFKVSNGSMLIIFDDVDLEFGRIKIKEKGGDGGHKGVRSIINSIGTGDFCRLRMGIGRPGTESDVTRHVLSPFSPDEQSALRSFIDIARDAVLTILCKGVKGGMNRFNSSKIEISS